MGAAGRGRDVSRHVVENATHRVFGYWTSPRKGNPTLEDLETAFDVAKTECVESMEKSIQQTKDLTFKAFIAECGRKHHSPARFYDEARNTRSGESRCAAT